jgi:hypothetical protein
MNMINRTHTAFRNAPLTDEELFRVAPSIFARSKHDSRSDRFQPIPTIDIVNGLRKEGFQPFRAIQSRTRDESRREYTKHQIRFRPISGEQKLKVGDTFFEIILTNGNDGTAAYNLEPGLFRIRCLNGMISVVEALDSVKVRHGGTQQLVHDRVIEGTFTVLNAAEQVLAAPQDWGQLVLDRQEARALARAAKELRFDEGSAIGNALNPDVFLDVRRFEDRAPDLWTTFNVVQENVIKGGQHAIVTDANNRQRNASTREVKGIDQDTKLNRALWVLAQEMAAIKRAA